MRAALIVEHGSRDNVVVGEYPKPEAGAGEVLVRVKAVSLNHLDIFVRRGIPGRTLELPHISGGDVSGVVAEIGEGVTNVQPGDRVLIDPHISNKGALGEDTTGGLAEYVAVPASNLIPLPDEISFEDAAALPIAYGTAWRMLITRGKLQANETILILGASGGVGNAAVLIAKLAGAKVIAAAGSDDKAQRLKELGADYVINYNTSDFSKEVWTITGKKGADVVVDYTGKATWPKSIKATRFGGRILTCGATTGFEATTDLRYVWVREISIIGSNGWAPEDLHTLLDLVQSGKIKPVIDRVLPLEEIREAHRLIEEREFFGKILITP
ncbi:zinc-binding dehydrogenase [Saccharibacillus sp. CPCC 101409]|uniref:zinc-binding dehydrogenase n=1 Tax=Saccharibacillus sp. CPCC 101409 TaxID=3058041 RepID=UPI0026738B03|nr:zinc-binding dehydrogenase [Saccharibacillus sp. CPCC 101409]MDO3409275.1 zinc-binding dehydrogenase [Saccharibacillus sp. CPCC 101409]